MNPHFKKAFNKIAMLAGISRMGSKLVSKGFGSTVRGAKNLGHSIKTNPGKTFGAAATMGFAGMEAANVVNKVNSHITSTPGINMKAPSFYQRG